MKEKIEHLKARVSDTVVPAMATPLLLDGYRPRLNSAVLPHLVRFLLDRHVGGLFVAGTTGEGILLDTQTRQQLCEATLEAANGQRPIIVHVGAFDTDTTLTLARHAANAGADAVAIIPPPFYPLADESIRVYLHTIAATIPDTPLLLYDIPQNAVNGISPALLAQLGAELPSLAGIKSSRPDAQQVRQLLSALPERAFLLAGNEAIGLGLRVLGAHGQITGLSTAVPEPFVALNRAVAAGQLAEAQRQQRIINQLLAIIPAGQRIGAIKRILAERGVAVGPAVPPRPMPSRETALWEQIRPLLDGAADA